MPTKMPFKTQFYKLLESRILTALLAEHKEKLSGPLFHCHIYMRHETHQFVSNCAADFRPFLHILQGWQHLYNSKKNKDYFSKNESVLPPPPQAIQEFVYSLEKI